jgi:hypothetical protein
MGGNYIKKAIFKGNFSLKDLTLEKFNFFNKANWRFLVAFEIEIKWDFIYY